MEKNQEIEFETLKSNKNRLYLLCGIVCVVVLLVVVTTFTLARYRTTQRIQIAEGKINYKVPDFNMVGLYIANESGEYMETDTIPASGYTLNMEQSYCGQSQDGEIVKDDTVNFVYENGSMTFSNVTKKGTKCYLYFDLYKGPLLADLIKEHKTVQTRNDFSTVLTSNTTGIIYQTSDNDGTTYYFAGNTNENWIRFGGYYWRIIRINGDGSIRIIYAGEDMGSVTNANRTGTTTQISLGGNTTTYVFNNGYDSPYHGLKYTLGVQHGSTTNSELLNTMETWYANNLSITDRSYIDTSAWFCSDREMADGSVWDDQPTGGTIWFAAYERLDENKNPTLTCTNPEDMITTDYGLGLITADEVAYAGGVYELNNTAYYLYTNQNYWTMSPGHSPYFFSGGSPYLFIINTTGQLDYEGIVETSGVRPVINLKSETTATGTGTSTDPFVVS